MDEVFVSCKSWITPALPIIHSITSHAPKKPNPNTAHPQPDRLPPDALRPPRHLPNPRRGRPHPNDPDGAQDLVAPERFAGPDQGCGGAVVIEFWVVWSGLVGVGGGGGDIPVGAVM